MEDLLNPGRCDTMGMLVDNMAQRVQALELSSEKQGVWYNIPVAMSRDMHISKEGNWNKMIQRLQKQVDTCVCEGGQKQKKNHWSIDLFPASKKFVVYHVLKVQDPVRGKAMKLDAINNCDYDEHNELDAGLPLADPIYHMYIECRKAPRDESTENQIAGRDMQFMDIMYNRWAVQNGSMLRKRILERKAEAIVQELGERIQDSSFGERSVRGQKTNSAIAVSRMLAPQSKQRVESLPQTQGYARRRW
jgi:hypothetical protein